MLTDPRSILTAQTPSQAQVQDLRRRTNQQPAIEDAQVEATLARGLEPIGSSRTWWGLADPEGGFYMITDGRELDPIAYPELYVVLGARFNTGGETPGFFRIPNPTGRTLVVAGAIEGDGLTDRTVGAKFGSETHTLDATQMPTHDHPDNTTSSASADNEAAHSHSASSNDTGGHDHGMSFGGASNTTATGSNNDRLSNVGGPFASGTTGNAGSHSHNISVGNGGSHSHAINISVAVDVGDAGGGGSHPNIQPSMAAYEIIRVLP